MTTTSKSASLGVSRAANLPTRFYKDVTIKDEEGGAASLLLDGKPVRTPGKSHLIFPTRALAEAAADEWRAQQERIDPSTMPLTKLANSAIDGVRGHEQTVIDDILKYAGSDLLCYRAEGPKALVASQTKHWDPVLSWAKATLDAPLNLAEGVVHGQWNEGQDHQSRDPSISAQTALALIRGRPRLGRIWLSLRVGLLAGEANRCRNQGRSWEGWPPRRGRIFSAQRLKEALRQGGNILMRRL